MFRKLNDKELEIYDLDNTKSLIDRIAVVYKSVPRYLYFPYGKPKPQERTEIFVRNLLGEIRTAADTMNQNIFTEDFLKILKDNNLDLKSDVIIPYFSYYRKQYDDKNFNLLFLNDVLSEIKKKF